MFSLQSPLWGFEAACKCPNSIYSGMLIRYLKTSSHWQPAYWRPLRTECTEHKMGIRSNDPVFIDQAPIDTARQQQIGWYQQYPTHFLPLALQFLPFFKMQHWQVCEILVNFKQVHPPVKTHFQLLIVMWMCHDRYRGGEGQGSGPWRNQSARCMTMFPGLAHTEVWKLDIHRAHIHGGS